MPKFTNLKKSFSLPFVLGLSLLLNFLPAYAATASFYTSGGGTATVGQTIKVSVSANGSEAYNAVTVNVSFTNLTYVSASGGSGWTPVDGPRQSGNTIVFSGAMLGGTANGSKNVLNLTFRAPGSPGTSTIKSSGTIALANGSGTQVSGGGNTATYKVGAAPTAIPTAKPAAGSVKVTSSSHPDSNIWYKSKKVDLAWDKPAGVTAFSYELNQSTDTNPDDNSEGGSVSRSFETLVEGKNYFHIKAKNDVGWGSVTHFAISVDLTAPEPFTITFQKDSGKVFFATNDNIGVTGYSVKIDGVTSTSAKSNSILPAGAKVIEVTAQDGAGNTTISSLNLNGVSIAPTKNIISELTSVGASTSKNSDLTTDKDRTLFQKFGMLIAAASIAVAFVGFITIYPWMKRRKLRKLRLKTIGIENQVMNPSPLKG